MNQLILKLKEKQMKKLILIAILFSSLLSGNVFAHVKTLYSDKGITTYCVDGMKFAVKLELEFLLV